LIIPAVRTAGIGSLDENSIDFGLLL